jgi:hypothetical protein
MCWSLQAWLLEVGLPEIDYMHNFSGGHLARLAVHIVPVVVAVMKVV